MFCINNEKNKSAVILNPERSEWVSRSHVTSVEPVVNDGAKTQCYSAKRDLYGDFAYAQPLKMTALTILLSLNLSTAWAAKTCDCGSTENGGSVTDCCWEINNGVLTITAADGKTDVKMRNYDMTWKRSSHDYPYEALTAAPWGGLGVTSVVIGDNITKLGDRAFLGESRITNVEGMNDVTTIGKGTFNRAKGLTSIYMPKVEIVDMGAFYKCSNLTSVDIPNATTVEWQAFENASSLEYVGLYQPNITFGTSPFAGTLVQSCTSGVCGSCGDKYVKSGMGCVTAENCGEGYTADNETKQCLKNASTSPQQMDNQDDVDHGEITSESCYANGQVYWDNACVDEYPFAKKRWTPAEASKWLHDGNDNFVVITFKK